MRDEGSYDPPAQSDVDAVRAQHVAACDFCDSDGYRGSAPCNHVDYVSTTEHGRELAKAELAKIAARIAHKPADQTGGGQ